MSQFRTTLKIPPFPYSFEHKDTILSIGSCFVENMGKRFKQLKFNCLLNPFGILYNPISIGQALTAIIDRKKYSKNDLIYHNERWHSFDHHSIFSDSDANEVLEGINFSIQKAYQFLSKTNRLILTLGTSFVYENQVSQKIVANCHKIPATEFHHFQLSVSEIVLHLKTVLERLKNQNSALEVCITVSPIRHIRLGLVKNQRSKAALLLATQQLCKELDFVHYFPAYEIVLDDLRDYRFYESDMIHPNQQAIDYIWEQFGQVCFSDNTLALNQQLEAIARAVAHRPFAPDSAQHQNFKYSQLQKIKILEQNYPFLNFEEEKAHFS